MLGKAGYKKKKKGKKKDSFGRTTEIIFCFSNSQQQRDTSSLKVMITNTTKQRFNVRINHLECEVKTCQTVLCAHESQSGLER